MKEKKLKLDKITTYIWCCDKNTNTGEGILANKFICDFKKIYPNYIYKIKSPINKKNYFLKKNYDRFVKPLKGIIYLWSVYLSKKHSKLCYVNYLPIWNFIIFIFLPPKTILGPITGGSIFLKKPFINYIIRKYILNFFCVVSKYILKFRQKKLLFATNLLQNKFKENDNFYYNYVLKDLKLNKTFKKKSIDLIIYLRDHSNKNNKLQKKIALELCTKFRIAIVGEKLNYKSIKNYGYIPRKKLGYELKKTKFSLISSENLYSFFAIDSITNGSNIIYNDDDKINDKFFLNRSYKINFNNFDQSVILIKNLINNYKLNSKNLLSIKNNFKNYFLK